MSRRRGRDRLLATTTAALTLAFYVAPQVGPVVTDVSHELYHMTVTSGPHVLIRNEQHHDQDASRDRARSAHVHDEGVEPHTHVALVDAMLASVDDGHEDAQQRDEAVTPLVELSPHLPMATPVPHGVRVELRLVRSTALAWARSVPYPPLVPPPRVI